MYLSSSSSGGNTSTNAVISVEEESNIIITFLKSLIAALSEIAKGAVELITQLANAILDNLPLLFSTAMQVVTTLIKINVSISITLRAELDEMAQIGLCDTVKVVLDNFGTEATAKITEATYDSLMERWDKLVVGTARVTVADVILNRKRYGK